MPDFLNNDTAFARARAQLDNALGATSDAEGRAKRCATVLRTAWPAAVLCACRIGEGSAALDGAGRPCKPPDERYDSGQIVAPISFAGETFGRFAVELPDASPDDALRLELLAAEAASTLAAEALRARGMPADASESAWLMRLGEVVGPVTHEFNNFLNTLLLQVAVLELTAPDPLRAELGAIRTQGRSVAALIKVLQQYRRQHRPDPTPVDLNAAVQSVATDRVRLELDGDLPPVVGHRPDVERLVAFLLSGAAALSDGDITARTTSNGKSATLTVAVAGGANPGRFAAVVEGPGIPVHEPHALELAACHSLTRRLNGALRADGTCVVAELPIA